jgi:hypothetical protein
MKNVVLFLLIIGSSFAFSQKPKPKKIKFLSIDQKVCRNQKGFQLVLKEISNDSRCPKGVTCIWAGEVTAVVSLYKDSKLIEDRTLVFSMKNEDGHIKWLSTYLPEKKKKVKRIYIVPYPENGIVINPKDYHIKIAYIR